MSEIPVLFQMAFLYFKDHPTYQKLCLVAAWSVFTTVLFISVMMTQKPSSWGRVYVRFMQKVSFVLFHYLLMFVLTCYLYL